MHLDAVSVAVSLIKCPSVTPAEGGALTYLESVLRPMGFECHRLTFAEAGTAPVDNLFARLGSAGPHLCFAGHTDVVPEGDVMRWTHPPFRGDIADGILFGRGAVDMKGGIASFVAAVSAFLEKGGLGAGSISFLITGDEEGISINGTERVLGWMAETSNIPDVCIVGEPTSSEKVGDTVKIGRRGSVDGTITVTGHAGHVAYASLARNPIPQLVAVAARLCDLDFGDRTVHFPASHLQFTSIDVGNPAENVIPGRAVASFNIRFNDTQNLATLERMVRTIVDETIATEGISYVLEFGRVSEPFLTEQTPALLLIEEALEEVTGVRPERSTSGGTSDARFIRRYAPVFELGLLNKTIHQVDEQVPVSDLIALSGIYNVFLNRYFARG